jgi:TonB family protein
MTKRLLVCLAVSLSIHALVIVQPWALMASSGAQNPAFGNVPVKLMDQKELPRELFEQAAQNRPDEGEGISFEAEGYVSAGYLDLLKARIFKAWEYPPDAIRDGLEGVVRIRFVLDAKGGVMEAAVIRSSGSIILDDGALAAVRKAAPFGPFSDVLDTGTMGITGNFCYVLD